jgi:hypothetical protein
VATPAQRRAGKRDLEDHLGVALLAERDAFWAAGHPTRQGKRVTMPTRDPTGGSCSRCARRSCQPPRTPAAKHGSDAAARSASSASSDLSRPDRFELQPQLTLRFVQEDYLDAPAALLVRATTRWRCSGSLADRGLHAIAPSESS